jgi:hypothetical protein
MSLDDMSLDYVSSAHMFAAPRLSPTPAEEMTSIAWSYAALRHLALDPGFVFQYDGYKGEASSIIENFTAGRYFGVPMLQFYGMALEPKRAAAIDVEPYHHMLRWLR